jgi:hypothetical protein
MSVHLNNRTGHLNKLTNAMTVAVPIFLVQYSTAMLRNRRADPATVGNGTPLKGSSKPDGFQPVQRQKEKEEEKTSIGYSDIPAYIEFDLILSMVLGGCCACVYRPVVVPASVLSHCGHTMQERLDVRRAPQPQSWLRCVRGTHPALPRDGSRPLRLGAHVLSNVIYYTDIRALSGDVAIGFNPPFA